MAKTAYLHKATEGYILTICAQPCNGADFNAGEKIEVIGKREARKVCEALEAEPHNF